MCLDEIYRVFSFFRLIYRNTDDVPRLKVSVCALPQDNVSPSECIMKEQGAARPCGELSIQWLYTPHD